MVRITTDQYHKMIEQGIIPEDASTELLNGVIVHKDRSDNKEDPMGHGPAHRLVVRLLTRLAARVDSDRRHLQIQLPIHLSDLQEPEPDAAIILGRDRDYAERLPTAADVVCVIEVAHSSLERDAEQKLTTYSLAGIGQYVIINLRDNCVAVYEQPTPTGSYSVKTIVSRGQSLRLNIAVNEKLDVAAVDILP
jgi:Uma2 family endonuclease